MNSRSSGSARVTIGKSSRRLRIVRPMAHFAIGQAPSSSTGVERRRRAPISVTIVAGARLSSSAR